MPTKAKKIIQIITASISVLSLLLAVIMNAHEIVKKEDYYEPVSVQSFGGTDGLLRAQGMTTDGEAFIFSSNYGLIRTELDAKTVIAQRIIAIPPALLALGCKHIGGITYYNGKIYAPIEDSKVFKNLYITTFDAKTLEHIESFALPVEEHENGVPWCVADPEKGVIYSAGRDHITKINVYDAETLEFLGSKQLETSVHKVQGGEMFEGILYLSVSREEQAVFALDIESGKVRKAFARNLVEGSEGEGMTILPFEDGSLFHVMDIAKIRLGTHLRHYDFDPAAIEW